MTLTSTRETALYFSLSPTRIHVTAGNEITKIIMQLPCTYIQRGRKMGWPPDLRPRGRPALFLHERIHDLPRLPLVAPSADQGSC